MSRSAAPQANSAVRSTEAAQMRNPAPPAVTLYARENPEFGERVAHATALLQSVSSEFPGRVVLASSLGAEDMVLIDMISRQRLPIPVATLDTGRLHAQTLALIERSERRYALSIERHAPRAEAVITFVDREGADAMYRSVELRKACCALRKLEPLQRLLAGREAWITGLRRDQSGTRLDVPFREHDADGRVKLNPLADWRWSDVWHYIAVHQVPYNPLHDAHMPSIGCEPCTRAISLGEDFRAGRWWWEDQSAKECGLHFNDRSPRTDVEPSATADDHLHHLAPAA